MKSGGCHKLVRMGRWQRGLIFLLLALAFVDMTLIDAVSPELCNDGAESSSEFDIAGAVHEAAIEHQNLRTDQNSHSDSTPASTGEDCFCCCSHILLGQAFNVARLIPGVRLNIPSADILPNPPPQDTFHPPRLV
ncbi:MAG: hypothetical protein ACREEM_42345 [Blastocatellia bacterium]